ncbi:hypothetical protein ACWDKQ_06355 [Saccharopolyspora sp. NPDC000995]
MTIPHVPSNPEGIAYASEQNALIDQCNNTANTVADHTSTLSNHGTRLLSLASAPPPHAHPIGEITDLRTELDNHAARLSTLETAPAPALDDLADVATTGATDGQVLKFSAGTWALAGRGRPSADVRRTREPARLPTSVGQGRASRQPRRQGARDRLAPLRGVAAG